MKQKKKMKIEAAKELKRKGWRRERARKIEQGEEGRCGKQERREKKQERCTRSGGAKEKA